MTLPLQAVPCSIELKYGLKEMDRKCNAVAPTINTWRVPTRLPQHQQDLLVGDSGLGGVDKIDEGISW